MSNTKLEERPSKRTKLLSDDSGSEDSDVNNNVVKRSGKDRQNDTKGFKINEEYAKRFEHNKKREELQRLEEKYNTTDNGKRTRVGDEEGSDEDDDVDESTSEEEDDDAEFATADVDQEISETLRMIKEKDPRVYDTTVKFYKEFDPDTTAGDGTEKAKEKPMYLHDYHRQNLMEGFNGEDADGKPITTYQQEQDALKRQLVGSMHAQNSDDNDDEDEDEDLLIAKSRPQPFKVPAAKNAQITDADIKVADQDPEKYLSNFMAARAWLPNEGSKWQPFESDDSEDEARAEGFEEAYNMRFEDPLKSNETLKSFARDVGKYGVRRDEKTRRKLAREQEREIKEARKRERDEEKARLRKLKVEEAEEKVRRIKSVAGIKGKEFDLDDWRDVIEGDFDDEKWEAEMMRRFGDSYYAQADDGEQGSDGEDENTGSSKRKVKKPKWDDDIDIQDLVPEFDEKDPDVRLTSDEEGEDGEAEDDAEEMDIDEAPARKKPKTKKDRLQEKADAKRAARKERAKLESIIDSSFPLSHPDLLPSSSSFSKQSAPAIGFRYRETSPTSFGLSARDILFAEDSQLNQFAGLKKFAAFRDDDKKRRDRKKFSKKARLRQWRKETFGDAEEPVGGFERILGDGDAAAGGGREGKGKGKKLGKAGEGGDGNGNGAGKKRKRKEKKRSKEKVGGKAED